MEIYRPWGFFFVPQRTTEFKLSVVSQRFLASWGRSQTQKVDSRIDVSDYVDPASVNAAPWTKPRRAALDTVR